jgi:hypothetical protein
MDKPQPNLGASGEPPRRRSRYRKWRVLVVLIFACLLLLVGILLRPPPRPDFPPLPQPNGYDDLLLAGKQMQGQAPDVEKDDTQKLRAFVDPNQGAIELIRQGLRKESGVPIDFTLLTMKPHMDDMGRIRNLARLLNTASVLAEREGRLSDSANFGLDLLRLGPQAARGGLLMDALVGIAIHSIGIGRLSALRDRLDADTCRTLIDALDEIDAQREPIETVIRREDAWAYASYDWKMRIPLMLSRRTLQRLKQPAEDSTRLHVLHDQARLRLLMTHLAIRRYRLTHGKNPESLADLVPNDVSALPLDPFSGRALIYRPEGPDDASYLLYSVGPDRKDDGGTPIPKKSNPTTAKGDYVLDQ